MLRRKPGPVWLLEAKVVACSDLCVTPAILVRAGPENARVELVGCRVNIAARAKERVLAELPEEQGNLCEEVLMTVENPPILPWIGERVQQVSLKLHGGHFDIHSGNPLDDDPDLRRFEPLSLAA